MVVVSLASGFPMSVVIKALGTTVVATKIRGKIFLSILIFGIISQMVVMEWILYKFWVAVNKVLTIIYEVACSLRSQKVEEYCIGHKPVARVGVATVVNGGRLVVTGTVVVSLASGKVMSVMNTPLGTTGV